MSAKEKTPNYSAEQIAVIEAAAAAGPIDGNVAEKIGKEIGKTKRSVISKVKSMEIEYVSAVRPVKGTRSVTKQEMVDQIADFIGTDSAILSGLQKATAASLKALLEQVAQNAAAEESEKAAN